MEKDLRLRRAWAEVDLDALSHNYATVRQLTAPTAKICCVIKANAYGHGAVTLARFYEEQGADFLAVSNLEEALELRCAEITLPILILGYTPPEAASILAKEEISQCVFSLVYAKELASAAEREGVLVKVHFKVDTGMGRIGFDLRHESLLFSCCEEIKEATARKGFFCEGIFTHFASADEGKAGEAFTKEQLRLFLRLTEALEKEGVTFPLRHAANSAAILDYPESHLDMVRAGIILYGIHSSNALSRKGDLRPALTLKTVVDLVKTLRKGESASYSRRFVAKTDMAIATLPIGYADGLFRASGEKGLMVYLNGEKAPFVGRICMDQSMIDLSHIPEADVGDEVTVFGGEGEPCFSLAEKLDTIPYELLCAIGERIPRAYLRNGEIVSVFDRILP